MKLTKAAMFGLDARIALAIFGALSVISGAALYSAIQQGRVVAVVSEMNELGKAVESYMLDVGADLSNPTNTTYSYEDLVVKPAGVSNWNGPYFPFIENIHADGWSVNHPLYGNYLLRTIEEPLGAANSGAAKCSTDPCFYWIQMNGLPPELAKAIDVYVDGAASEDSGRVRLVDADATSVFFQGPLVLNKP